MRSFILVLFSMALAFTSANAEVKKGTTTFEAVNVDGNIGFDRLQWTALTPQSTATLPANTWWTVPNWDLSGLGSIIFVFGTRNNQPTLGYIQSHIVMLTIPGGSGTGIMSNSPLPVSTGSYTPIGAWTLQARLYRDSDIVLS